MTPMKRYVIRTDISQEWNASSKARKDAERIALEQGYELFRFSGKQSAGKRLKGMLILLKQSIQNWHCLYKTIENDAIILIQYPIYPQKSALWAYVMLRWMKKRKNARFVALIHDLNSARNMFGWIGRFSDHVFLKQFDGIICHTAAMEKWLCQQGAASQMTIILQLFDYFTDALPMDHHREQGIAIAGNLEESKSGYIYTLGRMLANSFPLHLYGKGYISNEKDQAIWHGAYPPEQLPAEIQGAFGLIWDGPSVQACEGPMGQYQKLNSPHKTSLYLASGMPVFVWREAAVAPFISKHQVGLTIASLEEIPNVLGAISPEQYRLLCHNAQCMGERLRKGEFLSAALKQMEKELIGKGTRQ